MIDIVLLISFSFDLQMKCSVDFKKSKGNYFVDVDGNTILDLYAGAAGFVLGYNNDDAVNSRFTEKYDRFITHKVNASALPSHDLADLIRENAMPCAPPGMTQVYFGAGTSCTMANETCVAAAMQHYAKAHGVDSMSKLCVVGFNNSNHGHSTAALSFSSVDANPHNLPAFPWPKAEFPKMKYPFASNQTQNMLEEERCVQSLKNLVQEQKASGTHVAAIIIEPMSSYGQEMATPTFYRKILKFAKAEGIPFIVDETITGLGASGKNWAHQHWFLQPGDEPDYVTFGGKAGIAGFYSNNEHRLDDSAAYTLSQNVSVSKLLKYGETWSTIQSQDWLALQKDTASFLKIELARVGKETGNIDPSTIRGYGTHLAFDVDDSYLAQRWLWRNGINVIKCGPNTIGLRPSLTLGCYDAAHLRNAMFHYNPNFALNLE